MPELPEVETIKKELCPLVDGQKVNKVEVFRESIIKGGGFVASLEGRKIIKLKRVAKYLLFELDKGFLLAHLGMTGKFTKGDDQRQEAIQTHDRARFFLSSGQIITYSDIRCFGFLTYLDDLESYPRLQGLGPDALNDPLDAKAFKEKAKGKNKKIRDYLLDQRVIAGVGNIYANEACFRAKIRPAKKAGSLKLGQWERLLQKTQGIIKEALVHNGTSISDYKRVDDKSGDFQNFLQVYGKDKSPCPICQTIIKREVYGARSAFFCPRCQLG
ncbi:MAG: bifunctional DNA-formamidopyrimidine glycosylase/DNA-(apurinic or apyrimidinic site) lyase [SAR324 cluster bacterium]|nr:bifunctional DNA-formamidopyrimidine glycosylase/DNA-(apurinic or apyrimidinic site) lyase [SAR324 cluster bacterium]